MLQDGLVLHRYQTSVDRAGAAIALGALICALIGVALLIAGGQQNPLALTVALFGGWLLSAMAITAVAAPLWLMLHLSGRRSLTHAALTGAAIGLVLFTAAQTHGFGLGTAPLSDAATALARWASALATSLILALVAALIGAAMWRVAYFRVR